MKKVLISIVALLVLSMVLVAPTKAKTVELYESHIEIELIDPGKEPWISEDGILHFKDSYWKGTEVGTLGEGTFEEWYEHLSINLETGEGTASAKWLLTLPEGNLSGSWRGKITQGYILSGTFVGTHGTGDLEGVKKMGSIDGMIIDETHAVADITGIIIYPWDD